MDSFKIVLCVCVCTGSVFRKECFWTGKARTMPVAAVESGERLTVLTEQVLLPATTVDKLNHFRCQSLSCEQKIAGVAAILWDFSSRQKPF